MPSILQEQQALQALKLLIKHNVEQAVAVQSKQWLSMAEASQHACCSVDKLNQLIDAGEIIAAHKGVKGKTVTVSRKSIEQWHERNIYKPKSFLKSK